MSRSNLSRLGTAVVVFAILACAPAWAGPKAEARIVDDTGLPAAEALPGCTLEVGDAVEVVRDGRVVARGRINSKGSYLVLGLDRRVDVGDLVRRAAPGAVATVGYPKAPPIPRQLPRPPPQYDHTGENPTVVVISSPEMNAYATYYRGRPVIAVTDQLGTAVFAYSYYVAAAEAGLVKQAARSTALLALAAAVGSRQLPSPPRVPVHLQQAVLDRANVLYAQMMTYVLAHEYAHLSLGHVHSAFAALGLSRTVGRYVDVHLLADLFASRMVEMDADTAAVAATAILWGEADTDYAVTALCRFMALVEELQGRDVEYLSSHPSWSSRLEWMQTILRTLGIGSPFIPASLPREIMDESLDVGEKRPDPLPGEDVGGASHGVSPPTDVQGFVPMIEPGPESRDCGTQFILVDDLQEEIDLVRVADGDALRRCHPHDLPGQSTLEGVVHMEERPVRLAVEQQLRHLEVASGKLEPCLPSFFVLQAAVGKRTPGPAGGKTVGASDAGALTVTGLLTRVALNTGPSTS